VIQRLVSFPNVIVTGHQAFFTEEAIGQIMQTTIANLNDFAAGASLESGWSRDQMRMPAGGRTASPAARRCADAGVHARAG
jgi:phosphoglycerate dehydrogenase-like enzyme